MIAKKKRNISTPPGALSPEARDLDRKVGSRSRRAGLQLDSALVERLTTYLSLLLKWNQRINLTGVSSVDEAVDRLLVEPVVAARFLPPGIGSLLDIGSGGGSPAIPLKLARSGIKLGMVESKVRKCAFLRECVRALELTHVDVHASRVEELLARPELHESFDAVTVRAVRLDPALVATASAFLVPGGRLMLFAASSTAVQVPTGAGFDIEVDVPLVDALQSRLLVMRRARG
ncbi:MAG: 16S rRNA (guanine(527)-N(7))-methyltransferase RsmG [Vicinamibacterales bacterium]